LGESEPKLAIKLYLQFLQVVNELDKQRAFNEFTYETASECLLLYESHISDPDQKLRYLETIIGTVQTLECVDA